ncbi:adaptor protein MecA [Brotaphodocola catenula]|uniref:Adaptor protein MecA n=1 Tax=Brotaphodocola catenula TaxID=2885361 RepID=A0AAE3DH14_9FIRM|nr:adaptor protein MecA [Brotaphodocola catenula]MCC2163365.1 adaptor protein MecA [Brotaphodocola catenula]
MRIERINDNQIRCTLTSTDLSTRNLNLGELAYGSEKARSLFREMIQKASTEVGFDAEDDIPLMVEAIPLSGESVMLVITKIEDPEELDTRFSKFSQLSEEDPESSTRFAGEFLEGADDLMEYLNKELQAISEAPDPELSGIATTQDSDPNSLNSTQSETKNALQAIQKALPVQTRIYRFDSLDQVSEAARVTVSIPQGINTLYKKPGTSQYYLVLSSKDMDPLGFSRICNILSEYGTRVKPESASEAYYQEHYEIIVRAHALEKMALI